MSPATVPSEHAEARWPLASVLVVDDEPGMRHFLEKTLAPRVGQVLVAESAEQADALVRRHRFDLLILDISLPGQSGIEWLKTLRARGLLGECLSANLNSSAKPKTAWRLRKQQDTSNSPCAIISIHGLPMIQNPPARLWIFWSCVPKNG